MVRDEVYAFGFIEDIICILGSEEDDIELLMDIYMEDAYASFCYMMNWEGLSPSDCLRSCQDFSSSGWSGTGYWCVPIPNLIT